MAEKEDELILDDEGCAKALPVQREGAALGQDTGDQPRACNDPGGGGGGGRARSLYATPPSPSPPLPPSP